MKKIINWIKCLLVTIGIMIGTIVGGTLLILFLGWITAPQRYSIFLLSLPSIFLVAMASWLYRKWYGAPRVCPTCDGSGKACSGGGMAAVQYDCTRCNKTGIVKGSKLK